MGWNEWPLIIFTVLAQSGVGAFLLSVCAIFFVQRDAAIKLRLERSMLLIWIVMGLAFLTVAIHLGSPFRALNSLFRFGQASLSNEVVFGSAFIGCGGLAWLLSLKNAAPAVRKVLYLLAVILSFAFIWNMVGFYLMATVPTWNTPLTPLTFLVTAGVGGAMLANVVFGIAGISSPRLNRIIACIAAAAVMGGILVTFGLLAKLPHIQSSAHQASALVPDIGGLQGLRFILLVIAVILTFRFASGRTVSLPVAIASLALVLAGELIGRGVFFALHMTVGLV